MKGSRAARTPGTDVCTSVEQLRDYQNMTRQHRGLHRCVVPCALRVDPRAAGNQEFHDVPVTSKGGLVERVSPSSSVALTDARLLSAIVTAIVSPRRAAR